MFRLSQTDFPKQTGSSASTSVAAGAVSEHCHSFHELVLVKSGCAIHLTDGRAVHISRGSVFYLSEDDSHMFDQMKNLCLTNVLFRPEAFHHGAGLKKMLGECCHPAAGGMQLNTALQQQSEQLLGRIGEENDKQDEYSAMMIEVLFSQLAVLLYRSRQHQHGLTEAEQDDRERLQALISYINENYREEIDWNALSERFPFRCARSTGAFRSTPA